MMKTNDKSTYKNNYKTSDRKNMKNNHQCVLCSALLWLILGAWSFNAVAMEELSDAVLAENVGKGLLIADQIAGVAGSNMTFYRMALNAEIAMNLSIDKLQLGCGGFNNAVVANACDIDIDYVVMMGRDPSGQPGAVGAGAAATSQFKMTRPYLELAIKNDGDGSRREIVGFKIGAAQTDGFMSMGRYTAPGSAGASSDCTSDLTGAGAFYCHEGINRLSGYMYNHMKGDAYGCFNLFFACDPGPQASQTHQASFDAYFTMWGTRINRIQTSMSATSDIGGLTVNSNVNQSLRFIHGMVMDSTSPAYAADDFFMSFQREAVAYPTYNKTNRYSHTANPGWWMNIPQAELTGLKAYNVVANAGSLFTPILLQDPDIGQRAPDNCFGGLKFC